MILCTEFYSRLAIAGRIVTLLAWTETLVHRLPDSLFYAFRAVYLRIHAETQERVVRDPTWDLWKHVLRHGTARDHGYVFWPDSIDDVWPITGPPRPMPYYMKFDCPIANRGGRYFAGALHLDHPLPPGVRWVSVDRSACKRAAYLAALGEKHVVIHTDVQLRQAYDPYYDSDDSNPITWTMQDIF